MESSSEVRLVDWLNYHHLLYFWMVAREGTIAQASKELRLAQPTISGQIRALENSLGEKLFTRQGRNLVLTEVGEVVYRYADEIFTLGRELSDTLKGQPTGRPSRLRIGISDVVPKLISYRLLEPALKMNPAVHVICHEGKSDHLLADLSIHQLDIVLADAPLSGQVRVKAFNHLLGECGVTVFGKPAVAKKLREGFPNSLDRAPMLLPTDNTLLRRSLEHYFDSVGIRPHVVTECEDSALMKVFGEHGVGLFPSPSVIEKDVIKQYNVEIVGRIPEIVERFYAITVERRIKHPAVAAISDAARGQLFRADSSARKTG